MNNAFIGASHQFRLRLIVSGESLVPFTAGYSRFHFAQEGADAGNPRPINLRALLRLPDALLGGSVLGHHHSFWMLFGAASFLRTADKHVN